MDAEAENKNYIKPADALSPVDWTIEEESFKSIYQDSPDSGNTDLD